MRVLVDAREKDVRVAAEHLLGPVAVMNIEIHDEDLLDVVMVFQVAGRDGDVVEEAEAHGLRPAGVVTGGAHGAERPCVTALLDTVDGGHERSRGPERRPERAG